MTILSILSIIFALPELMKYLTIVGTFAMILTVAVYKIWTTLQKVRNNARFAAEEQESKVQDRINILVEAERDRCLREKVNEDGRIKRLREIAEETELQTKLKEVRMREMQSELDKLQNQIKEMRVTYVELERKYASVLEINAGLIADVKSIRTEIEQLKKFHHE